MQSGNLKRNAKVAKKKNLKYRENCKTMLIEKLKRRMEEK
jgi:hypothetical protein